MSSQSTFNWFGEDFFLAIHEAQIAEHGGATGVRDPGFLAWALARSQNAAAFWKVGVQELAVLHAIGIIRNRPFVDGNKRVGTGLLETSLQIHDYELVASDGELLAAILAVTDWRNF